MSRHVDAALRGEIEVLLICDNCERQEWRIVAPPNDGYNIEYLAVEEAPVGSWSYTDDLLACSQKCASALFDWPDDGWDPT